MKKILSIIIFVLLTQPLFGQNAVGYSWGDVMKMLKQEGHIISQGQTDDNVSYISGMDSGRLRIYYFTENNLCFLYVLIVDGADYNVYRQSLIDSGYNSVGDKYYKDYYTAEIFWSESQKVWALRFGLNNPKTKYNKIY